MAMNITATDVLLFGAGAVAVPLLARKLENPQPYGAALIASAAFAALRPGRTSAALLLGMTTGVGLRLVNVY